jgi:hypothetical protein
MHHRENGVDVASVEGLVCSNEDVLIGLHRRRGSRAFIL